MESQQQKARTFLSLHSNETLLVLPNIWNPIGARILEARGYPAIATASAAISASLGYADGEKIKRSTLIDIITRIARSVDVPVTADIEAGFADSIPTLRETVLQVVESGVVGINLEDGVGDALRPIEEQCERIAAVRETAGGIGLHLVINARIDSFVSGTLQTKEQRMEDAIARANAYSEAGADCVYPMGPGARKTLEVLRDNISAPLNVLATPRAESLAGLQEIGVNRVSFGPFIFRSCLSKFVKIVDELHAGGGYEYFARDLMSADDISTFLIHEAE